MNSDTVCDSLNCLVIKKNDNYDISKNTVLLKSVLQLLLCAAEFLPHQTECVLTLYGSVKTQFSSIKRHVFDMLVFLYSFFCQAEFSQFPPPSDFLSSLRLLPLKAFASHLPVLACSSPPVLPRADFVPSALLSPMS